MQSDPFRLSPCVYMYVCVCVCVCVCVFLRARHVWVHDMAGGYAFRVRGQHAGQCVVALHPVAATWCPHALSLDSGTGYGVCVCVCVCVCVSLYGSVCKMLTFWPQVGLQSQSHNLYHYGASDCGCLIYALCTYVQSGASGTVPWALGSIYVGSACVRGCDGHGQCTPTGCICDAGFNVRSYETRSVWVWASGTKRKFRCVTHAGMSVNGLPAHPLTYQ